MKVLITREIPQAGIRILEQYRELELVYLKDGPLTEEEMIEQIKDVECNYSSYTLTKLTKK